MHKLQACTFDITGNKPCVERSFQSELAHFVQKRLVSLIDDVCTACDLPGSVIKIDRLVLDLGEVDYVDYQFDIEQRLRDALQKELKNCIAGVQSSAVVISHADEQFSAFMYYLEHGSFPWNAGLNPFVSIDGLFEQFIESHVAELISFLRKTARNEHIRRRIVLQFDEKNIQHLIRRIEPVHSAFIETFLSAFDSQAVKKEVTGNSAGVVKPFAYELTLSFLLVDRGSDFNRKEYVKWTVAKLSGRYNVALSDILDVLVVAYAQAKSKISETFFLLEILEELNLSSNTNDEQESVLDPLDALSELCAQQKLVAPEFFAQLLREAIAFDRELAKRNIRQWYTSPGNRAYVATLLSMDSAILLVELFASNAEDMLNAVFVLHWSKMYMGRAAYAKTMEQFVHGGVTGCIAPDLLFSSLRQTTHAICAYEPSIQQFFSSYYASSSGKLLAISKVRELLASADPELEHRVLSNFEGSVDQAYTYIKEVLHNGKLLLNPKKFFVYWDVLSTKHNALLQSLFRLDTLSVSGVKYFLVHADSKRANFFARCCFADYSALLLDILPCVLKHSAVNISFVVSHFIPECIACLQKEGAVHLAGIVRCAQLFFASRGLPDFVELLLAFPEQKIGSSLTPLFKKSVAVARTLACARGGESVHSATNDYLDSIVAKDALFYYLHYQQARVFAELRIPDKSFVGLLAYLKAHSSIGDQILSVLQRNAQLVWRAVHHLPEFEIMELIAFVLHVNANTAVSLKPLLKAVSAKASSLQRKERFYAYVLQCAVNREHIDLSSEEHADVALELDRSEIVDQLFSLLLSPVADGAGADEIRMLYGHIFAQPERMKTLFLRLEAMPSVSAVLFGSLERRERGELFEFLLRRISQEGTLMMLKDLLLSSGAVSEQNLWKSFAVVGLMYRRHNAKQSILFEQFFRMLKSNGAELPKIKKAIGHIGLPDRTKLLDACAVAYGESLDEELALLKNEIPFIFNVRLANSSVVSGYVARVEKILKQFPKEFSVHFFALLRQKEFWTGWFLVLPESLRLRILMVVQPSLCHLLIRCFSACDENMFRCGSSVSVAYSDAKWHAVYEMLLSGLSTKAQFVKCVIRNAFGVANDVRELIRTNMQRAFTLPNANVAKESGSEGDVSLPEETVYIDNAGLVLLAPYIPMFLDRLGLCKNGKLEADKAGKAVMYLQYLVSGEKQFAEHHLVLNKILCGYSQAVPVDNVLDVAPTEETLVSGLLASILQQWSGLGNTSVSGLRSSFLMRSGRLTKEEHAWHLHVYPHAYDMLLDSLPWSYQTVKYSWMKLPVITDWR